MSNPHRIFLWFSATVLLVLSVGLIWWLSRPNSSEPPLRLAESFGDAGWAVGAADAPHTLVVYSDLQCPACARYHSVLRAFRLELPADVRLIYRHFPLKIHTHAFLAALCTEAAGRQGKFWEMQDLLYARQKQWVPAPAGEIERIFAHYAEELDLKVGVFLSDLYDPELMSKVRRDKESGEASGVYATPTLFADGVELQNLPNDVVSLRRVFVPAP